MSDVRWYRSLYWRIALGFVALVATLLAAQGVVFLWMTGRMTEIFPTRSPAQFASALATDVGATLAGEADTDLQAQIAGAHSSPYRSFAVALADGRTLVSETVEPSAPLIRAARGRLLVERGEVPWDGRRGRGGRRPSGPGAEDGNAPAGPPAGVARRPAEEPGALRSRFDRRSAGRGAPGLAGGVEYARVLLDGEVVGMVAVPRELPPMSVTLRAIGPVLGAVALALLVAGTAVAALVIFRPTRRRLGMLQDAARQIGAGELGIRAPEAGGDEVTALSRAFNEMAGELERRTSALETADRTRRQLLADVSHELMTPLSAIRGYVETLQMPDLPLDGETRTRYLRIVSDEAERLEQIIGDLLDLARLEGGGTSFREENVPARSLIERIGQRHERALAERRIALDVGLADDVPAIRGDRTRLEQALQNLVANAIRHTPEGGRIGVGIRREAQHVVMTVEDSGPGIPPEYLDRVFERFYKVDQSRTGTDVPSGSGLGLSIVRAVVERHGGRVEASNTPGGGARFAMYLPIRTPVDGPIG